MNICFTGKILACTLLLSCAPIHAAAPEEAQPVGLFEQIHEKLSEHDRAQIEASFKDALQLLKQRDGIALGEEMERLLHSNYGRFFLFFSYCLSTIECNHETSFLDRFINQPHATQIGLSLLAFVYTFDYIVRRVGQRVTHSSSWACIISGLLFFETLDYMVRGHHPLSYDQDMSHASYVYAFFHTLGRASGLSVGDQFVRTHFKHQLHEMALALVQIADYLYPALVAIDVALSQNHEELLSFLDEDFAQLHLVCEDDDREALCTDIVNNLPQTPSNSEFVATLEEIPLYRIIRFLQKRIPLVLAIFENYRHELHGESLCTYIKNHSNNLASVLSPTCSAPLEGEFNQLPAELRQPFKNLLRSLSKVYERIRGWRTTHWLND